MKCRMALIVGTTDNRSIFSAFGFLEYLEHKTVVTGSGIRTHADFSTRT